METFLKGLTGGLFITGVVVTLITLATVFFIWLLWEREDELAPQSNYLELVLYERDAQDPSSISPKRDLFISCPERDALCKKVLAGLSCESETSLPEILVSGYYNQYIKETVRPACPEYSTLQEIIEN